MKHLTSQSNNKTYQNLILGHKSLMRVLNNRSRKVEACATPESIGKGANNLSRMRTKEMIDNSGNKQYNILRFEILKSMQQQKVRLRSIIRISLSL
jgi:hypothetical protein